MLTASFILTAAFELAIAYIAYENKLIVISLAFGTLLFESTASIYFEDKHYIKTFRNLFKDQGIDSQKIDLIINLFRSLIYIMAITQFISYTLAFWTVIIVLAGITIYLATKIEL